MSSMSRKTYSLKSGGDNYSSTHTQVSPHRRTQEHIIDEGRKSPTSSNNLKRVFTELQYVTGPKDSWELHDIFSKHSTQEISYDEAISQFLSLKTILYCQDDYDKTSDVDVTSKLLQEEEAAYRSDEVQKSSPSEKSEIKRLFSKHIFRYVLFFEDTKACYRRPSFVKVSDEDLSQSAQICERLLYHMEQCDVSITHKVLWWKAHNKMLCDHLNALRSRRVRMMMNEFLAAYHRNVVARKESNKNESFQALLDTCDVKGPFAEDFLGENPDLDIYKELLMIAFSRCYAPKKFLLLMQQHKLSEVITIPEEAFALFCLENNFSRWQFMATAGVESGDGSSVRQLDYTSSSSSGTSTSVSNKTSGINDVPDLLYQENIKKRKDGLLGAGSYTNAGKERLNYLIDKVEKARETRKDIEATLQSMFQQDCTQENVNSGWIDTSVSRKRKSRGGDEASVDVYVKNCLRFASI